MVEAAWLLDSANAVLDGQPEPIRPKPEPLFPAPPPAPAQAPIGAPAGSTMVDPELLQPVPQRGYQGMDVSPWLTTAAAAALTMLATRGGSPPARHRPPAGDSDLFGAGWGGGSVDGAPGAWAVEAWEAGGAWAVARSLEDRRHNQGAQMLRKWWNYIRAWFGKKSDEVMDPEIEIEQAIQEAQKRDQELRNQAAKVIAHRTQVENQLGDAVDDLGAAKEMAKQALLKADTAQKAGHADEAARWTDAARTLAMRMQAAQSNVDMLKAQFDTATKQAEQAKQAVNNNAMQLQEISAKRMQMLGQLQSAKMQETVNKAMDSLNASVGDTSAPSLDDVEKKIEARLAEASAHAELKAATPEGVMADLEQAVNLTKADDALDSLRAELGLSTSGALPPASASAPPPLPPPPPSA